MRLKPFLQLPLAFLTSGLLHAQTVTDIPAYHARGWEEPTLEAVRLTGIDLSLQETPRAITVLDEDLREALQIEDIGELGRYGAGSQRPNYLGIAGTAFLRGDEAGLFFEGMRRSYQLLAFPPPTLAVDSFQLLKGPAPAAFGVSQAGGSVNQQAKRSDGTVGGQAQVRIDSEGQRRGTGSFEGSQGDWQWHVSWLGQDGDTYYRRNEDERAGLYASFATQLGSWDTFTGFELYRWEGRENLGWNQLSQDLINHARYSFAGGETVTIRGSDVLIGADDRAEAENLMAFLFFEREGERWKFFFEAFDADKREPSNGFSYDGKQWLIEGRHERHYRIHEQHTLDVGLSLRHTQVDERFGFGTPTLFNVATGEGTSVIGSTGTAITTGHFEEAALFANWEYRASEDWKNWVSARYDLVSFSTAQGSHGGKNSVSVAASSSYALSERLQAYGTVQQATALIPGEGGSISSEANFAESELYEVGLKWLSERTQASLSTFYWDTAEFETRTGLPEKFRSAGLEFEARYGAASWLHFVGSAGAQRTWRRGGAPLRLLPNNGFTFGGDLPTANTDLVSPGLPEVRVKLLTIVQPAENWEAGLSANWNDGFWTSYDRFYRVPSSLVFDGYVRTHYRGFEIRLGVENLTDEDWYSGTDPNVFGNELITREPERHWNVSVGYRW